MAVWEVTLVLMRSGNNLRFYMNYSLLCKLLDGSVMDNGKEKGRFETDFLTNMTANYDLESIKENVESLRVEN